MISSRSKTRAWSSGSWIRNEPPPSSLPLPIRSYACASACAGVLVEALVPFGRRTREGVVDGRPALVVLVPLEHREVGHPAERRTRPRRSARARGRGACAARRARATSSPARRRAKSTVVPGSLRKAASSCSERNFAIGERTSPSSSYTRYASPFAPHCFANSSSSSSSRRENACGTRRKRTASRAREDAELGAARELGRVLDLEPEAKVGLVGAEAAVGLLVRHPRERRSRARRRGDSRQTVCTIRSISVEDELLVGEGHLDVELGDLLDAVGAEILVAEADRDLVVAVEAGDHEQLLEDLRGLRQREEAAGLQPARARRSRARPRASA